MTTSFDKTPVSESGFSGDGGTIGDPKRRSTVPSLYTLITESSSISISFVLVEEAIEDTDQRTEYLNLKQLQILE